MSVDALGSAGTLASSVRSLRRRGRHVQVGLLLGAEAAPPVPMDLVIARELEIYGSHGMAAGDYPPMLAQVADGTFRPGLLVGEVIGLEQAGPALAAMDGPRRCGDDRVIPHRTAGEAGPVTRRCEPAAGGRPAGSRRWTAWRR